MPQQKVKNSPHTYLFWAVVIVLLLASYFILRPYMVVLISSFVLAFLIRPVHIRLASKINPGISAAICVLIVVLIFILPFTAIIGGIARQAYQSVDTPTLGNILEKLSSTFPFETWDIDIGGFTQQAVSYFASLTTSLLLYIPHLVLSVLVIIFSMYYILINWEYLSSKIESFLPFKNRKKVSAEIANSTKKIVYGYILIALIEFIIASLGFFIAGVKFYLLLPALIALFAFIPGLGPIAVWLPTALYYLATENYYTAIIVLITGVIISIGIDYFLVLRVLGSRAQIHPLILLLGILGGVPLFGLFGIIIGPLLLVYTIKIIQELINEQNNRN